MGILAAFYKFGDRTDAYEKSLHGADATVTAVRREIAFALGIRLKPVFDNPGAVVELTVVDALGNPLRQAEVSPVGSERYMDAIADFISSDAEHIVDYRTVTRSKNSWCDWAKRLSWTLYAGAAAEAVAIAYLLVWCYAFGSYVDPDTDDVRDDLDWIKSDQKVKGKPTRDFKRSYRKLATELGAPFEDAIESGSAVDPDSLTSAAAIRRLSDSVVKYQQQRIRREFENDEDYADFADDIPEPAALLAPYFYIEPSEAEAWMNVNLALATETARAHKTRVHAVVCAPREFLLKQSFQEWLLGSIARSGIAGVWLWFSKFDEYSASVRQLQALRMVVEELGRRRLVILNMHGGFYSLALSNFGLTGISHGVGYGEQKDVVPVIGQSTPTVRYYLPALHKRLGVPDIERCFRTLKIRTADDFFARICDCVICKGVLRDGLDSFAEFGEKHYSHPESKREAQTPAAAKRCRFHYLLNRVRERNRIEDESIVDTVDSLNESFESWQNTILGDDAQHISRWAQALS